MTPTPNPFTNRGPVTNREDFFGRKDELEIIVSRLRTMPQRLRRGRAPHRQIVAALSPDVDGRRAVAGGW